MRCNCLRAPRQLCVCSKWLTLTDITISLYRSKTPLEFYGPKFFKLTFVGSKRFNVCIANKLSGNQIYLTPHGVEHFLSDCDKFMRILDQQCPEFNVYIGKNVYDYTDCTLLFYKWEEHFFALENKNGEVSTKVVFCKKSMIQAQNFLKSILAWTDEENYETICRSLLQTPSYLKSRRPTLRRQ